ncbi:MAG: glycosyltransferase family 4 protein [Negativicutes bacterium]|nr:glycosyltransferase family 4 protein [Negativicutes bacterium]
MKKVLFWGPDTSQSDRFTGGIDHIIQPLKNCKERFAENGIDISFFNTERISRSAGSDGKFAFENFKNAFQLYKDCSKELENNQYDVLLVASSVSLALLKDVLIANRLKKKHKVKVMLQIHCADMEAILPGPVFGGFIFKQIRACDGCIYLSQQLMEDFTKKGFPADKSFLLYNYYNMDLPEAEIAKKLSGPKEEAKTNLIFIGSFDRRKGVPDLLSTLDTIEDSLYFLNLCGGYSGDDAELKRQVEKFCADHPQSVINNGYVRGEKKSSLFSDSDVLLLPSYTEGLPVVLLEAMAAGCAIITTNVGSIAEIVKDGQNGYVISAGDTAALRAAILSMINDKQKRQMIQSTNYAERSKYTMEQYIDQLSQMLHSV